MRIVIGADHAGLSMKPHVAELLEKQGHEVIDVGAHSHDPQDDYPDFARLVAQSVADGRLVVILADCWNLAMANGAV